MKNIIKHILDFYNGFSYIVLSNVIFLFSCIVTTVFLCYVSKLNNVQNLVSDSVYTTIVVLYCIIGLLCGLKSCKIIELIKPEKNIATTVGVITGIAVVLVAMLGWIYAA
ncbi:hypothetical protein MIJ3_00216 [Pseudomonas phage vB_PaeM_MIJ3]|nr:hypothetical protein Cassandra_0183 [Pseudomonas phage Cassandra]WPK39379.1 hypothetical protein Deiofobo_0182 [Pseudomonas phage Deifobo]WPK39892.1 hypothetical protein ETTORE_0183 [Pseudomonas phage Ettore]WPK40412.1 hypothetical protein Paride_0182 [Pseudomonas phage Paride]VOH54966.1 hypothetical protein MIJ3_00216 [Pseudomonas phage vB_PaeM_MIJ3]